MHVCIYRKGEFPIFAIVYIRLNSIDPTFLDVLNKVFFSKGFYVECFEIFWF